MHTLVFFRKTIQLFIYYIQSDIVPWLKYEFKAEGITTEPQWNVAARS